VAHVTTAFLLDTLAGDAAAGRLLDSPADLPMASIETSGDSDA
jgi:hypothetical protein